jgi:hypothetical protein
MQLLFFGIMAATLVCGIVFCAKRRGGYLFAGLSGATFLVSSAALVSFICLYFYELPSHHCPFCILQKEYHYIGYALYATLLGGTVGGLGVGALMPFAGCASLSGITPGIQRRLAVMALVLFLMFTLIVVVRMFTTPFTLSG